jgi:hypothetical protein
VIRAAVPFPVVTTVAFPGALRCMDCDQPIPIGGPFSERLDSAGHGTALVEITCVYCALEAT